MASMKLGTTSQNYASADFAFPNNPKVVNIPLDKNDTNFEIPYSRVHVFWGEGGVGIRRIILNGEMKGANRLADLNNLASEIHSNNIKRFWISDLFYYNVIGRSLRHTYQGGRTNFIDYVVSLDCVTPYALAAADSTYTVPLTNANKTTLNDATGSSSGVFTNAGNAPVMVKWQIENAAGSNITQIEIGDTNDYDTSPRKITWTGTLASGSTLLIDVFNYVLDSTRGDFKVMRYAYPTVSGTKSGNVQLEGLAVPSIDADGSDQAFSIKLTGNDATANVTATWNSSYIV